jgi:hypothetical protein
VDGTEAEVNSIEVYRCIAVADLVTRLIGARASMLIRELGSGTAFEQRLSRPGVPPESFQSELAKRFPAQSRASA